MAFSRDDQLSSTGSWTEYFSPLSLITVAHKKHALSIWLFLLFCIVNTRYPAFFNFTGFFKIYFIFINEGKNIPANT